MLVATTQACRQPWTSRVGWRCGQSGRSASWTCQSCRFLREKKTKKDVKNCGQRLQQSAVLCFTITWVEFLRVHHRNCVSIAQWIRRTQTQSRLTHQRWRWLGWTPGSWCRWPGSGPGHANKNKTSAWGLSSSRRCIPSHGAIRSLMKGSNACIEATNVQENFSVVFIRQSTWPFCVKVREARFTRHWLKANRSTTIANKRALRHQTNVYSSMRVGSQVSQLITWRSRCGLRLLLEWEWNSPLKKVEPGGIMFKLFKFLNQRLGEHWPVLISCMRSTSFKPSFLRL